MGEVEPAECKLLLNSESKNEGGGEVVGGPLGEGGGSAGWRRRWGVQGGAGKSEV